MVPHATTPKGIDSTNLEQSAPPPLIMMFSGESESVYFGFRIPSQGRPTESTSTNETYPGRSRGPSLLWRRSLRKTARPSNQGNERVTSRKGHSAQPQNAPMTASHVPIWTDYPPEVTPTSCSGLQPENRNSGRNNRENETANIIERLPGIQKDLQPQIRTTATYTGSRMYRNLGARVETGSPSLYEDDGEQDNDSTAPDANPRSSPNSNYEDRDPSLCEDNHSRYLCASTFSGNRQNQTSTARVTIFSDDAPLLQDHDSRQIIDRPPSDPPNSATIASNVRHDERTDNQHRADSQFDKKRPKSMRKWLKNATLSPAEAFCSRLLHRNNETRSRTTNITAGSTSQGHRRTQNEGRNVTHQGERLQTAREPPMIREQAPGSMGEPPNATDEAANNRAELTITGSQPTDDRAQSSRSWEQRSSNIAGSSNSRALDTRRFLTTLVGDPLVNPCGRANTPSTRDSAPRAYVHPYVADPSVITEDDRQGGTGSLLL